MKVIKKVICVLTLVGLVFCETFTVYAADPYSIAGSQYGAVTIQPYSDYGDLWIPIINAARTEWNNCGANISFTVSSSSSNRISINYLSDTWYGQCAKTYNSSTGYISKFTITMNSRTISNDAINIVNLHKVL